MASPKKPALSVQLRQLNERVDPLETFVALQMKFNMSNCEILKETLKITDKIISSLADTGPDWRKQGEALLEQDAREGLIKNIDELRSRLYDVILDAMLALKKPNPPEPPA